MYIRNIFKRKLPLSFEVFPPKKEYNLGKLYNTVTQLKELDPDFVSVTYGAGGGTKDKTIEIVNYIKNNIDIESVAHFTCVNSSIEDIKNTLENLKKYNIKNILALRGDAPAGKEDVTEKIGGFKYAYELVEYLRSQGDWSIAVAGYPEGHEDIANLDRDITHLKIKMDKGADVIITQLFFDNASFYNFREKAVKSGIKSPIIPGVFPILNYNTIQRVISMCNAHIPQKLLEKLEKYKDDPQEIEKIGIEYAVKQSEDLINNDIHGIHFYTMNKSGQIKQIVRSLNLEY